MFTSENNPARNNNRANEAVRLYNSGLSFTEIVKVMGGTRQSLYDMCRLRPEYRPRKLSPAEFVEMWPTPRSGDGDHGGPNSRDSSGRYALSGAVAHWPAPMSSDADKNSRNREKHLAGAVQKYPTPTNSMMTVQDMEQARFAGNDPQRPKYGEIFPTALADAVSFWPAPRTAGMCGGTGNWAQLKKNAASIEEARQMGAGNGGQLNPGWEERLMGYPDGWTDVERENIDTENRYPGAWADGSWDTIPRVATRVKNRVNRIKCLGNAVVPQIPMIIFSLPVFDVFRKGAPL